MHKKMPATTWLAWVHVFNYFTCLLDRGASKNKSFDKAVATNKTLLELLKNEKFIFNKVTSDNDVILLIISMSMIDTFAIINSILIFNPKFFLITHNQQVDPIIEIIFTHKSQEN